jgi:hypothetical protein
MPFFEADAVLMDGMESKISISRRMWQAGSSMVLRTVSRIQPRINLRVSQKASPLRSFLREAGSLR